MKMSLSLGLGLLVSSTGAFAGADVCTANGGKIMVGETAGQTIPMCALGFGMVAQNTLVRLQESKDASSTLALSYFMKADRDILAARGGGSTAGGREPAPVPGRVCKKLGGAILDSVKIPAYSDHTDGDISVCQFQDGSVIEVETLDLGKDALPNLILLQTLQKILGLPITPKPDSIPAVNTTQWKEELYKAIQDDAPEVEDDLRYGHIRYTTKTVPGLVACRFADYIQASGSSYYVCQFGTLDGFSVADRAFDYIHGPSQLVYEGPDGKVFEMKFGPLACRRMQFSRARPHGDTISNDQQYCEVNQTMGFPFNVPSVPSIQ